MRRQPGLPAHAALGDDVVQQHRIDAADGQIGVRMDVVVVGDRLDAVRGLSRGEQFPGQRAAQRRHLAARQILQRAEALAVGLADGDHLAELVVRDAHRQLGALGRRIFHAAQRDVEIAALHRLIQRCEGRLDELRAASECVGNQPGDLDVEATEHRGIVRIGLDEGRPTLGVAAPAQYVGLLRRRTRAGEPQQRQDQREPSHVGRVYDRSKPARMRSLSRPTRCWWCAGSGRADHHGLPAGIATASPIEAGRRRRDDSPTDRRGPRRHGRHRR